MASSEFEYCLRSKKLEFQRYYDTVLLTLGIKNYLENYKFGCKFVYSEPIFRTKDGEEVKPDIVMQYDDDKCGILCEVKTSIPQLNSIARLGLLPQLQKYMKEVGGWDTAVKWVQNHDVLLLVYLEDSARVSKNHIKNGK